MAFAQTVENSRQLASSSDIEGIVKELSSLKKFLRGNVTTQLSQNEMDQFAEMFKQQASQEQEGTVENEVQFITFLGKLQKSSCRVNDYEIERATVANEKEERGESLFSTIASIIAEVEIDKELGRSQMRALNTHYSRALSFFQRAKQMKIKVENLINSGDLSYEENQSLLLSYNDSLIKGLYDIKVILRPFINTQAINIDSLLPKLTTDVIEEQTELYTALTQGEVKDKIFFDVDIDGDKVTLSLNKFLNSRRDIVTINESPSAKNYLRSLRILTIQMMASQIKNYDVMIGSTKNDIVIPRSCRSDANGSWPHLLNLKIDESAASSYLETLVKNIGLSYDETSLEQMSVREASDINPIAETIVASTSVENFLRAAKGKDAKDFYRRDLKAGFDETAAYQQFIDMKMGEVMQLYRKKVYYSKAGQRGRSSKEVTTKDYSLIGDIVGNVSESKTIEVDIFEDGHKYTETIYPAAINASPYIASKLAAARTEKLEDIISDSLKNELKNNVIKVQFPSLYSQEAFRNWGLNYLHEKVQDVQDEELFKVGSRHNTMMVGYCHRNNADVCRGVSRNTNILKQVASYIDSLKIDGKFLPVSRLDQDTIKKSYAVLYRIYGYLRDHAQVMPDMVTNEYDYLLGQMAALNPLAKVRLGYLLAKEELTNIKNGQVKTYKKTARGMRVDYSYTCFNNSMTSFLEHLEEAAKVLKVDRRISPEFLTNALSKDEYVHLWNNIFDTFNQESTQVLTADLKSGKKAYEAIEKLSTKVTVDRNQIDKASADVMEGRLLGITEEKIDDRLSQEDVEKIAFYKEIMAAKSHKERAEIFESRPMSIDIFDDYELVHNFMQLNTDLKTPVYMEILKRSALKRQRETYRKLNNFCDIAEDDIDSLKENFYATVKIQDQLNQLIGIPAVPKELLDRMGDWSSDEKWAMFNGVFGFLLGMGAVLAAGSCTVLTGGLCGLAIAGAGTIGFGMQANAIRLETKVKFRADRSEEYVGEMADLGYTDSNATENVARGWMAVAFEVIGTISMISILTRSLSVGSKIFKESLKSIIMNRSKLGIKEVLKQSGKDASVIVNESEVEFAKLVLGLKKYRDVFKNLLSSQSADDIASHLKNLDLGDEFVESTLKKIDIIEGNYRAGKLSANGYKAALKDVVKSVEAAITKSHGGIYRYTSDVVVNLNYKNVDDALGATVSKLFNGSPLELRHYMSSYVKKLNKSMFRNSSKAARARLRVMKANQGRYWKGTNWIVRAWNENTYNLAKNRQHFLRIYDELQRLPEAELAEYISKNADTLTEIFVKIPLRKRDFPYMLIQGAPHTGGFFGRRVPFFSAIGEGVLVRKIFTARARLISEVARRSARETLGMKRVLMAETVGDLFKGLDVSVTEGLERMSKAEAREAQQMLENVKSTIVDGVFERLDKDRAVVKFLTKHEVELASKENAELLKLQIQKLLYSPNGEIEHAFARYLWASVDAQSLFKAPEFSELAYKVMRDTMQKDSIGSLQRYLNALKILQIRDNGALGSVELF